jgi:hypothetical protein
MDSNQKLYTPIAIATPASAPVQIAYATPVPVIGEAKTAEAFYPGQPNVVGQSLAYQAEQAASNVPVISSSTSCVCQSHSTIAGMWRFPVDPVKLHCCSCQGSHTIDARNLQFPASGNSFIETAGCQQRVIIYYPPGTQVNVTGLDQMDKDKRKKGSQSTAAEPAATKYFINVSQNKKCCCSCQSSVESYKLDHGQDVPKNCTVM